MTVCEALGEYRATLRAEARDCGFVCEAFLSRVDDDGLHVARLSFPRLYARPGDAIRFGRNQVMCWIAEQKKIPRRQS